MNDIDTGSAVQVWGYRVLWAIPLVLLVVGVVLWALIGNDTVVSNRDRRAAAGIAVFASLPVFAAMTYRLRLSLDRHRETLTISRRGWVGRGMIWEVPIPVLESWYYAESIQCFTITRHGHRPLKFVIWMGTQPAVVAVMIVIMTLLWT